MKDWIIALCILLGVALSPWLLTWIDDFVRKHIIK
jgi:hypothetical protein